MKKDLVLITSFTPDQRRQKMLRELVYGIDKSLFDVMLSSHTIPPIDILERADYFIYEKENAIDFNFRNKFLFHYQNQDFSIFSTEPKKYNHFIPVIRHIISGLIYAKNLGYNKVHYFEYDSLIENNLELIENSSLLDEFSAVYYSLPHLDYPNSPLSLNLDKISPSWFDLSDSKFESFLRSETSKKIVEEYEWNLLTESENLYNKNLDDLYKNGIKVALNADLEKNKWISPIYYPEDDNLFIFSLVEEEDEVGSIAFAIINNHRIINIDRSELNLWFWDLIGPKDEITDIKIVVNGEITRSYNFCEIEMEEFIKYNFLVKNRE